MFLPGLIALEAMGYAINIIVTILLGILFVVIPRWIVFEKIGIPAWKSIIPIYNDYSLAEATCSSSTAFLYAVFIVLSALLEQFSNGSFLMNVCTAMVSGAYLFLSFVVMAHVSKGFHKGLLYTIGLILLPPVFLSILGYSSAVWEN